MSSKRPLDATSAHLKRTKLAPDKLEQEDHFELELELSHKQKQVNTDGYDSDSSAGSDKTARLPATNEEAEEDMFKDDTTTNSSTKQFLDLGDIEGQEFGNQHHHPNLDQQEQQEHEEEEEEEEEYLQEDDRANDDDAPRSSRNKKTMGYTLSYIPPSPS